MNKTRIMDSLSDEERQILALDCQTKINASTPLKGLFCPGVFDSWRCWLDTPAGTSPVTPCPPYVYGFDSSRFAYRECTSNGTWFRQPKSGIEWSNYTACVNREDLSWRENLNTVNAVGYTVSLVALLISLIIFSYFRSLRCARITLHINLFTSFAVNNVLWLIWFETVLTQNKLINQNPLWCRVLHVLLQYALLSNYTLMLCEGLYLHTILVRAFTAERRLLVMLLLGGWLTPVLGVLAYTLIRASLGEEIEITHCWMNNSPAMNVLVTIVGASLLMNLGLLCNVVRVICTKLRAAPHAASRPSATALQALRATLLLVPLLGLQYLLLPFRPQSGDPWERTYEYMSAITSSFQGLCVAILFCFCNGEVVAQVRRKWRAVTFRPRANSCTATTVSFVRSTAQPTATSEEKV